MSKNNLIVLAVDDDSINLKLLKSMLNKSGLTQEIVLAMNGADAVDILKNRDDIDIVLLDIIMPVMNGIEAIKVIRADKNLKQVPIVVLTTDETKKTEALEVGANSFITKPIRGDDLITKIKSVLI